MDVKILDKKKGKIKFSVTGITTALANELRRIMVSEVPTMAIEWVDFVKNDSILWDEIVAHRLGLVPLTFDPEFFEIKETCRRCKGKGCVHCQVKFTLKKKGPSMVYSGDLKSSDKNVKPVYDKIPIVELFGEQEIELEAVAQLGKGKEHAKWQAAVVGFKGDDKGREFVFNVESVCGLKPEEIVTKAFDVLDDKLNQLLDGIEKLK